MTLRNVRRRLVSHAVVALCAAAVLLALVPLALVLFYVISQGVSSLNMASFTRMPVPVGETGGGAVAVLPFHRFSALAGGLALGIMMLPLVTRTTEELLLLVPPSLREAALALAPPAPAQCSPSSCRRRCRAFSPASCPRWRAWPGKPRRSSSPPSTTGSSRPTCGSRSPR